MYRVLRAPKNICSLSTQNLLFTFVIALHGIIIFIPEFRYFFYTIIYYIWLLELLYNYTIIFLYNYLLYCFVGWQWDNNLEQIVL